MLAGFNRSLTCFYLSRQHSVRISKHLNKGKSILYILANKVRFVLLRCLILVLNILRHKPVVVSGPLYLGLSILFDDSMKLCRIH